MSKPYFSIIVPTFNRPQALNACLSALNRIEYSKDDFEVIVVDDGSPRSLESVLRHWRDSLDIQLLRQENAGPAVARNNGAKQARGQFLAFTDDDCAPARDWLRCLSAQLQQTPDALVGGRTINALPDNIYSSASQLLIDYIYSFYNANHENATFFASNNFAVKTQIFRDFGGFDTVYTRAAAEDREFCDRWTREGRRAVYAPEIVIYHAHVLTLRSLWRQHFAYGHGAWQFHQSRNAIAKSFKPDPKFYRDLLLFPLRQKVSRPQQARLCALMIWMQIANLAGFLAAQRHSRKRSGKP